MINKREIADCLEAISPCTAEELKGYSFLIENERKRIEKAIKNTGFKDAEKAALLAAARVNYKIALIRQGADGVTSFTAGDVKITESKGELKNAKALLDEISADCSELVPADGFAFKTV